MDDYEIIEQYADYRIVQKKYNGIPCTFRHDYFDNSVRIKFDDNFARCNGYRNIKDLFTKNPDMKQSILAANLGIIPDWILITPDMGFVILDKTKLN